MKRIAKKFCLLKITFCLLLRIHQILIDMKQSLLFLISMVFILTFNESCSNSSKVNHSKKNEAENEMAGKKETAGPPAIIYQTVADYFDKVPVTLSEDKSEVVSYPGVKDVYYKGELSYPTKLDDDYFLDNRGIDANTAFLKLTYEEYSKLETTPTKEELYDMILDKDPIKKMYNCGSKYKYKDIVTELNAMINDKTINDQKKLK